MQPNWLDKTISFLSPAAGRKRLAQRLAAEALLSYEGVRSPRRQGGWRTTGASGNSEIGSGLAKLRENARDLCRNNAYAKRAVREWSKRVVGTGIRARSASTSEAMRKRINELWSQWEQNCMSDHRMTFAAAQKLMVRSRYESGEVLIRLWTRQMGDGLPVPFQIQLLESDFLDTAKTMQLASGYILHGVQFDSIGRIQGYWIFGQHPGDVIQTSARGLASAFVPAENLLHYAELERPGDVRAVTQFSAVINKLRDLDEYADAEIVRKKIEACLTAMITQPEGIEGPTAGPAATDPNGLKVEQFQPGMILYGAPGADAKFFAPAAGGDFSAHKKTELREVAVGLDIPYILLDDNMEAVNYSSFRGGLLAYRDAVEEHRWNWFIPQVLEPIWRRFVDTLVLMGEIPEPDYAVEWDPPTFDLLDRSAEAEADRQELQIGSSTWPQVVARRGYDPEAQITEISAWDKRLRAAGVTFAKNTTERGAEAGTNGNDQTSSTAN